MKKLLLTSATVFGIAAFCNAGNANIGANDSSASCDNSTIGASSGTTTLEAQWQANTITLKWYNDGEQFTPTNSSAAGECTYDTAITLPSNTLSKEGYTFDGWTVKAAAAPVAPNCEEITDDNICNATDGCHFRYYDTHSCVNAVLVENSSYNSCSEITDKTTCESIIRYDMNIGIPVEDEACRWNSWRGTCYSYYDHSDRLYYIPKSWCDDMDDYCWYDDSTGACRCQD